MGEVVRGFELVERVAQGGYGVVWRGVQASVGREVAVKVIRPELAADDQFLRRFRREAGLVAGLEHPHIVPLIDFWQDDDGAYLVMRWFGDGSLADRLEQHGPLSVEAAADLMEQVCGGLALAHRHGVIHRDVKPANVLLDADGNAYVTDFGIAKDIGATTALTSTGEGSMGSPVYMAPEQLEGKEVTAATDVYSLGILLYEVLTGKKPFGGDTLAAVLLASLQEPVPLVGESVSGAPAAVDDVIQRATAKDPADRYPDVGRLVAALRSALAPGRQTAPQLTNLPEALSSFVGRDAELDVVHDLLDASRLVTLTGVGGTGKTRLALEAARRHEDRFADGVWLVELAPLSDPSRVIDEIADTWGLREGEAASLGDVLAGYLAGKDLLLVLDNCEHVLTAVVEAVEPVLRGSPGLKVLATSRESLGIGGESVFHVPSLALPDDTEHAAESDAVKLFLDRVHSTRPDFDPTSEDLVHIVRICRRLDGIPLGLELAAARLRTLGTGQLADRLESSFRILTSGQKGGLPRQQTLTAAIEWSFDLLDPREQAVFRRLALFAGGFDLEAAEAVCAGGDIEAWETLDLLDQLVDKSLVEVAHGSSGVARYRLFEPIREYASGLLVISDPDGSAALAHAHYFAGLARLAEPHIRGPDQVRWAKRLDVEYDNLRAAFRTLSDNGDADAYLAMCFDLGFYWQHDGLNHEGIDTVLAMVDHPGADRRGAVKAWWVAAMLGFDVGDPSSIEQAEQGLAIATEIGDPNAVAWMKLVLGAACRTLPITRPDSAAHVREGYDSYRSHPEPPWFDRRWDEAIMEMYLGSYGPAGPDRQERYRKAIDGFREAGDLAMTATALFVTQFLAGEADEEWIFSSLTEAVEISRRTGYRAALGHSLYGWGARARARGELDGARSALSEAAQMLVEIGDTYCSAGALVEKVAADVRLGRIEEARSTLAEATRALLALSSPAPRLATQAEAYAAAMALRMGDTERAARYVRGLDELSDDTYFAPFALEFVSHREELAAAMSPAELERHSAGAALLTAGDLLADIHEWAANT